MKSTVIVVVLCIAWLLTLAEAINDATILIYGRIDDETNTTGIPTEQLTGPAKRPGFVRMVAALRLVVAAAILIVLPVMAIKRWW